MGKTTPRKKKLNDSGSMNSGSNSRNSRCSSINSRCNRDQSPRSMVDEDDAIFIELSKELKEEGTRLFQRRDYEGAAFKFDKAVKLLPKVHADVAYLHSNIAACYMHMYPVEYHHAIDECNLALEASPKYTKALLKRARCFEALDRLDLACRDVQKVLSLEPNNITALELSVRVREEMENGILLEKEAVSLDEPKLIVANERIKRKVSRKFRNSIVEEEVWEEIHDEEKQEMDEEENIEKTLEENQLESGLDKEDDDTEVMPEKNGQNEEEKHSNKMQAQHGQNRDGVSIEERQERHTSWDIEKGLSAEKLGQDKQERNSDEKQEKPCQYKPENHNKQKLVIGVDKCQKHIGETQINQHLKQEKHFEKKHGKAIDKQENQITDNQIEYGECKHERYATVGLANSFKEKHRNHMENQTKINKETMRAVKMVLGEDIRYALMPTNCSFLHLRQITRNKFPCLKAMHIKFKDKEGDLVTITTTEELRWVEELANPQGPLRLYVTEVDPERELNGDVVRRTQSFAVLERNQYSIPENGNHPRFDDERNSYADDWMMQFARLFKNHVGFDSDAYLDLHDIGMQLHYEAMEDTITSEEAQEIFQVVEAKFQEMTALALFNWGNVHMSRARKSLFLSEDAPKESILAQVKGAYDWACTEYVNAGKKYEEAVDVKPDFYEGLIALGQQQFEQAKLSWCYAMGCKLDMGIEVLELFNHAEDNMEKGMEIWEGMEYLRLRGLSKPNKENILLEKMGLEGYIKDSSKGEAFEQASNIRSQLNISWGTILYERSIVEFKLGLPGWEESLTEAIEKFKIGGASLADISVMIKNHCANEKTQEGLRFKIDEIVQAWNEMYDAKKWRNNASSCRLEPLFRRRPSKLHHILEHIYHT